MERIEGGGGVVVTIGRTGQLWPSGQTQTGGLLHNVDVIVVDLRLTENLTHALV